MARLLIRGLNLPVITVGLTGDLIHDYSRSPIQNVRREKFAPSLLILLRRRDTDAMHVDFRVTDIDVDRSSKDRFRPVEFVSSGMLNLTLSDLTTVDSAHSNFCARLEKMFASQ